MNYRETLLKALDSTLIYSLDGKTVKLEILKNVFRTVREERVHVFFIGNGGSAAIAEHMTTDYLKNGHIRTLNLLAAPTLTCLSNDFGYEYVFSKQLEINASKGDLLVAISSSGNSQNIVNAVFEARKREMKVLTFSGFDSNNKISSLGDYNVHVPSFEYGIVESIHNLILQQILDEINMEEMN